MRISLRHVALLALPALSNAVSLSDMTPRASGLPSMCEDVYTSQIYGCSSMDFSTQECSSSCIGALYGLSQAIRHACGGQGVTGQNLIVAFLAGVGPQAICHNADEGGEGMPTSRPQHTHWRPSIIESTTTAQTSTIPSTLLVDTSSTMTQTIIPHRPTKSSSSSEASSTSTTTSAKSAKKTSTTAAPDHSTPKATPHSSSSSTTSSVAGSQTDLNDHSGGGSPFDTEGNMGAASSISISLASMVFSAAVALLVAVP